MSAQVRFAPVWTDQLIAGDCVDILKEMPSNSIDLIVTSPPYADSRKKTFILNIKEKAVKGERHTYVLDSILEMRKQGWLWTEEFIWHKKSCHPGKWPNRFRDAWERCLQFNKTRQFAMYQDAVMIPRGEWAEKRLKNLSETDKRRDNSKVNSGFGKNVSNWVGRERVYPSNVIHMASETGNKGHSATFPLWLPHWFIRLFSKEHDLVLDPFVGSGTTAIAAKLLGRHYLGIDITPAYVEAAKKALRNRAGQLTLTK
jgi:site-specific DNA-methyltransferase (adenine-specific)